MPRQLWLPYRRALLHLKLRIRWSMLLLIWCAFLCLFVSTFSGWSGATNWPIRWENKWNWKAIPLLSFWIHLLNILKRMCMLLWVNLEELWKWLLSRTLMNLSIFPKRSMIYRFNSSRLSSNYNKSLTPISKDRSKKRKKR